MSNTININNIEALKSRLESLGNEDFEAMALRIATAPSECLPQLEASTKVVAGALSEGKTMVTGDQAFDIIASTSGGAPEFFAGDAARSAAEAVATALTNADFIRSAVEYLLCTLAH